MIAAINGPAVGVGRDDDAADGHPPGRRRRADRASCSRGAGSCPRHARAGSCRASSASAGRWSGWRPGACSRPGGARRRAGAQPAPRRELLDAARALARGDRREHRAGVGRARAPDDVDDARRRAPDARPPRRLARRCSPAASRPTRRGRHVVPREAPARNSPTASATGSRSCFRAGGRPRSNSAGGVVDGCPQAPVTCAAIQRAGSVGEQQPHLRDRRHRDGLRRRRRLASSRSSSSAASTRSLQPVIRMLGPGGSCASSTMRRSCVPSSHATFGLLSAWALSPSAGLASGGAPSASARSSVVVSNRARSRSRRR